MFTILDLKRSLQQSNLLSFKLPELMPGGFSIATDVTCQKIIHNPVAAKFFRIEAWESLSFSSLTPPQIKVYQDGRLLMPKDMPIQRAAWFGEKVTGEEFEFIWPDGISKIAIYNANPLKNENGEIIGAIATIEEVTELIHLTRELEAHRLHLEVAKLERLNTIGQMAAGLAHEVRNPMTTVKGFLQLLKNKADLITYKSYFDLMIEELDRADTIIHEFLSLTKNKPVELKRQCLSDVLANLFPLLQAEAFKQGKHFIFEPGDITDLDIDSNEITQLVLNFFRNGLEAMSQDRCLTISTFEDEQNIVLSVKDEGTGIIPEYLSKLGTPFFTTKENGTGLGIPMCYSIAERHSALIEVKTGPEGTTFLVKFPRPKETNIV